MSSSCYTCDARGRAIYICTLCEVLVKHGIIGIEEIYRAGTCSFHEAAIDVLLKRHLFSSHEQAIDIELGKAFRRTLPV